jgi:CubicO group peptidase (beta-lactamase class C family)
MTVTGDLESIFTEHDFSGTVLVSPGDQTVCEFARGHAHRALGIPNDPGTQLSVASATKCLTALTTASLIESGELTFDTTLVSLLGDRVRSFVDDRVTIRHLLGHTSGVGDYIDEDEMGDVDDPHLEISPGDIDTPSAPLPLLAKYPQRETPGEVFRYNNSGFVLLAIAVEAATGETYFDLVRARVTEPAGMNDTAFFRSDDLPAGTALGYLSSGRTNVFKLPVRGSGDGGAFSTVADLGRLWTALFAGRIVSLPMVEDMTTVHRLADEGYGYGLGFWMWSSGHTVQLEGYDAGVSCRSVHDRPSGVTYAVISNTAEGAWPVARYLDGRIRAGWVD